MPRQGSRPYECIRRAWHSERHEPIRGSIIQQIFRVVIEAHSPATKSNREWKEKLPVVVLRAEEIMYSKADSEAEYMNHETLWERVNEAVDTIIRRDESSEKGDLLPPCVEAALNLGCIPVRAPRSERHRRPRNCLAPRGQDPPPTLLQNTPHNHRTLQSPPPQTSDEPNYPLENVETNFLPSSASVYPFLHYRNQYLAEKSHVCTENPSYESILVGTPSGSSIAETPEVGYLRSLLPRDRGSNGIKDVEQPGDSYRKRKYDLSLRLGVSAETCESTGGSPADARSSYLKEFFCSSKSILE